VREKVTLLRGVRFDESETALSEPSRYRVSFSGTHFDPQLSDGPFRNHNGAVIANADRPIAHPEKLTYLLPIPFLHRPHIARALAPP
jgi:hypothetical protein